MITLSSSHISQLAGNSVVPVHCDAHHGTAFFIAPRLLLTARHVVLDVRAEENSDSFYVIVNGQKVLCYYTEIKDYVDVALLHTIDFIQDKNCCLPLLAGTMIIQPLDILGYPQEIGNGIDYFIIKVENYKVLENYQGKGFNIVVRRLDENLQNSYRGFSGSPVINQNGQAIGVVTDQFTGSLGYSSVMLFKDEIKHFIEYGVSLVEDEESADNRDIGLQTSQEQIRKAIEFAHSRYHADLHQNNDELEKQLRDYCCMETKPLYEKLERDRDLICHWFLHNSKETETVFKNCFRVVKNPKLTIDEINNLSVKYKLNEETDQRLRILAKDLYRIKEFDGDMADDCFAVIGIAGSGKTHMLCHFSENYGKSSQVYLFFGTEFLDSQNAWDSILDKLQISENRFNDLDEYLGEKRRKGVIIIDGLNEGDGDDYWKRQLPILIGKLKNFKNIKLIVSIRTGSEDYILDRDNNIFRFREYELSGFDDYEKAMCVYFEDFGLPVTIDVENYSDYVMFQNPLFLYIFCVASRYMYHSGYLNLNTIYDYYIKHFNNNVSSIVDEDPENYIASRYLYSLAKHSVLDDDFADVKRMDARKISDQISTHSGWKRSLLHACIKENLLIPTYIKDKRVKYCFDNIGDFLRAIVLDKYYNEEAKYDDNQIIQDLVAKITSTSGTVISNENYKKNAIEAFFSIWNPHDNTIWKHLEIGCGLLTDLVMSSVRYHRGDRNDQDDFTEYVLGNIFKLDDNRFSPKYMLDHYGDISTRIVLQLHDKLKMLSQNELDIYWTVRCNQLYSEKYSNYRQYKTLTREKTTVINNAVIVTWFCASSFPIIRSYAIRALSFCLDRNRKYIIEILQYFSEVKDSYVIQGLMAAVYGVSLRTYTNDIGITRIAQYIYDNYYSDDSLVPNDVITRQWQMKLMERAYYLNSNFTDWKKLLARKKIKPFKNPMVKDGVDLASDSNVFGEQKKGTYSLYDSLCYGTNMGSDFCRYTLHMNSTNFSDIYYRHKTDQEGVPMPTVQNSIIRIIRDDIGWNEKLAEKDVYTPDHNEFNNNSERIGKKYQWMGLYRVEAYLMDTCFIRVPYNSFGSEFAPRNFPWYSPHKSYFDPSLIDEENPQIELSKSFDIPASILAIEDSEIETWKQSIQDVAKVYRDCNDVEWIPIYLFDSRQTEKNGDVNLHQFILHNSVLVAEKDKEEFSVWASKQNFYGRWMEECSGSIDYLWNEYPWSDSFKSKYREEDCEISRFSSNKRKAKLAYMAQLQEDMLGLGDKDDFSSTVYMPCVDMMDKMHLYTAERGIVRRNSDKEVVSFNFKTPESSLSGMLMRKNILIEYLAKTKQVLFTCLCGDKHMVAATVGYNWRYFTGCYGIDTQGNDILPAIYHEVIANKNTPKETPNDDYFFEEFLQRWKTINVSKKKLTKVEKRRLLHNKEKQAKKERKRNKK